MNKKHKWVKRIITLLFVLIVLTGVIDYRVTLHSFEKPIFAQVVNGHKDGGSGIYYGLGYSI